MWIINSLFLFELFSPGLLKENFRKYLLLLFFFFNEIDFHRLIHFKMQNYILLLLLFTEITNIRIFTQYIFCCCCCLIVAVVKMFGEVVRGFSCLWYSMSSAKKLYLVLYELKRISENFINFIRLRVIPRVKILNCS